MNNKSKKTLYLVAGLYLLYLSYQLITGAIEGNNGNVIVSVVGGIAFLIIGLLLIVDCIRNFKKGFGTESTEEEIKEEIIEEVKDEEETCE